MSPALQADSLPSEPAGQPTDMHVLLAYLKWITSKDLPSSTGNSAQCYVTAWIGMSLVRGEWVHVCV